MLQRDHDQKWFVDKPKALQKEFSSKMRMLRPYERTIVIVIEPSEVDVRVFGSKSSNEAIETTALRLYKQGGREKTKVEFVTKFKLGEGVKRKRREAPGCDY